MLGVFVFYGACHRLGNYDPLAHAVSEWVRRSITSSNFLGYPIFNTGPRLLDNPLTLGTLESVASLPRWPEPEFPYECRGCGTELTSDGVSDLPCGCAVCRDCVGQECPDHAKPVRLSECVCFGFRCSAFLRSVVKVLSRMYMPVMCMFVSMCMCIPWFVPLTFWFASLCCGFPCPLQDAVAPIQPEDAAAAAAAAAAVAPALLVATEAQRQPRHYSRLLDLFPDRAPARALAPAPAPVLGPVVASVIQVQIVPVAAAVLPHLLPIQPAAQAPEQMEAVPAAAVPAGDIRLEQLDVVDGPCLCPIKSCWSRTGKHPHASYEQFQQHFLIDHAVTLARYGYPVYDSVSYDVGRGPQGSIAPNSPRPE